MQRLWGRQTATATATATAAGIAAAGARRGKSDTTLGMDDDMDFGVQPPAYGLLDGNPFFTSSGEAKPESAIPKPRKALPKPAMTRKGSGAHHAGTIQVPDRMRDSMAYFAADGRRYSPDESHGHNKHQRDNLLRSVMTSHSNMYTHAAIDKVRLVLDAARRKKHDAEEWRTVWTLLRTKNFCVELVREPFDEMPEGDRLYVDLDTCEDRRRPMVWQLDDGTVVMPIFSLEEYMFHYFQRNNCFESEWFPAPRNGTAFELFKQLDFPVLGHGGIHRMASLATVATGNQFVMALNPTEASCKLLTYPEMVHIAEAAAKAKIKPDAPTTARGKLFESRAMEIALSRDEASVIYTHNPTLHRLFDSTRWMGKRIDASTIPPPDIKAAPAGIHVPPIALDELRILVFDIEELLAVDLRRHPDGSLHGAGIVSSDASALAVELARSRLAAWSFVSEAESPITITLVRHTEPTLAADAMPSTPDTRRVYHVSRGEFFRRDCVKVAKTLREQLDYDATMDVGIKPTPPPQPDWDAEEQAKTATSSEPKP